MPHATLWLVMYDRSVTVPIERGENTGKTITYSNVVRKLRPIAMWKGAPMSVDLAKSEMEHAKAGRCAVLLQTENEGGLPGPIIGAAAIRGGLVASAHYRRKPGTNSLLAEWRHRPILIRRQGHLRVWQRSSSFVREPTSPRRLRHDIDLVTAVDAAIRDLRDIVAALGRRSLAPAGRRMPR